jgi:PilZ domain
MNHGSGRLAWKLQWRRQMGERRKSARSRTFLGGRIACNRHNSTMDCLVRNLSSDGALVTFTNTSTLPDNLDLTIVRKERSFQARMIWRRLNEAGLAFLSENVDALPIPLDWAKRLRECEAENEALRRRVEELSPAD